MCPRHLSVLLRKYAQLGSKPEFQRLRAAVPVLSIWDRMGRRVYRIGFA